MLKATILEAREWDIPELKELKTLTKYLYP